VIPKQIQSLFPPSVRARGEDYFTGRRVQLLEHTGRFVGARVSGTDDYAVTVEADPGRVDVSCTCPFAHENGVCKHQWATLREADRLGRLQPLLNVAGSHPEITAGGEPPTDVRREPRVRHRAEPRQAAREPQWKRQLDWVRQQLQFTESLHPDKQAAWPPNRRLVYIIDIPASAQAVGLVVELAIEKGQRDGSWSAPVQFRLGADVWFTAPDPMDRQLAQMLMGAAPNDVWGKYPESSPGGFVLDAAAFDTTLRLMCETGRCRVRTIAGERPVAAVQWDDGPPWQLHLHIDRSRDAGYALTGTLHRENQEMALGEPQFLHASGILLMNGAFARFDHSGAFPFVQLLRDSQTVQVRKEELPDLLGVLYTLPRLPPIESTGDCAVTVANGQPIPYLTIARNAAVWGRKVSWLRLEFRYGSARADAQNVAATVFDPTTLIVYRRDKNAEAAAESRLLAAGAKKEWDYAQRQHELALAQGKVLPLVAKLVQEGWHVEADNATYRAPTETRADVRSGIDWFELNATVRYGDQEFALPALIDAVSKGQSTITLGDGSIGLLPTEWLARLRPIAAAGASAGDLKRFTHSQVPLLDTLLATIPDVSVDDTFETARSELRSFERVEPANPPTTFCGTLREYQREGLGWLHFLRRFRLGGCLADDMGLGKTVQVLALLESLRTEEAGLSIVVVPRSLVFNWMREAERFAPGLRVVDYTGTGRASIDPKAVDIVITTYGTLRRDAPALASIEFEYAISTKRRRSRTRRPHRRKRPACSERGIVSH
jgi:hypothetical protein